MRAHAGCFCLRVVPRVCLFTCSFCVLRGVNAFVPTRAVPAFKKSNRLIDKERRSQQTKKNGCHSCRLEHYFFFSPPSPFYGRVFLLGVYICWSSDAKKRVTASPGCLFSLLLLAVFFFFSSAHMISVKVLRFSMAAAR